MAIELQQNVSTVVKIGPLVGTVSAMPVSTFTLTGADGRRWQPFSNGPAYNLTGYLISASVNVSGFYLIHLSAGTLSIPGDAQLRLTDESLILPYAHDYTIVTSQYWNQKYGTSAILARVVSFAADALSAPAIQTGAFSATKIGAGVYTSIASAILSQALAGYTVAGTAGANLLSAFNKTTTILADTDDIQTRLPAALVGGRMDATVDGTGLEVGAQDAISVIVTSIFNTYDPPTRTEATNDKVSLIAEFALLNDISVDQVSAAVSGAVSIRFDTLSAAVDGITATVDVLSVASAVWSMPLTPYTTAGQGGANLLSAYNLGITIQADTDDIQTRLPAALVGGRIDATIDATGLEVGAQDAISVIVTSALLTNGTTLTSVISGIWSAVLADYTTAGTAGADVLSTLNLVSAGSGGLTADQVSSIVSGAVSIRFDTLSTAVDALNDLTAAQVSAIVAGELVAYDPPTRTEASADKTSLIAEFALLNDISVDQVSAAVSGAVSIRFDTLSAAVDALNDLTTAQISTIVAGELVDYDPPTRTEASADKTSLIAEFALLNDISVDQVSAAVSGAVSARFNTLSAAVDALNNLSPTQISTIVAGELVDYDPPTRTEATADKTSLIAEFALLNDITVDQVSAAVSGAVSIRFDTLSAAVDGITATVDVLSIASAVWSMPLAPYTTAGQGGANLLSTYNLGITIQSDTDDIQTRLPAALVGGRIDATIDGTGLEVAAQDAISVIVTSIFNTYDPPTRTEATADKASLIAEFALLNDVSVDQVSAAVSGAVSIRFDTLSAAVDGITATVDVLSIASAVWSMPLTPYTTAGQGGANLLSAYNLGITIQTDTDDIQTRIPAALVAGRIDATIDGTGLEVGAQDAISVIVTSIFNTYDPPTRTEATTDKASLIAEFALLNDISVDQVSAAVSGAVSIRFDTLSAAVDGITATVDVLSIASAVWSTALANYTVAGQAGADLLSTLNLVSAIPQSDEISTIVTSALLTNGTTLTSVISGIWSAALADYTTAGTAGADVLSTLNLVSAGGAGLTADQVSSIVSGAVSSRFNTLSAAVDALNDLTAAQISTIVAGELVDYDPPTRTEATADKTSLIAEFALLNDVSLDQVSATVSAAVSARMNTLSAAIDALNDLTAAQISTVVAGEFVAYDPPTRTEASADKTSLIAEFALLNDISVDQVSAAVSGAVSIRFDTLSAAVDAVTATVDVLSIASAVWSMPLAPYTTAGQGGANLLSAYNLGITIQADTDDIQTRIPAALVGGRIDATIDGTGLETGAQNAISTIVTSIFNTYDPPTRTEATADKTSLIAEFALLNDLSVDQVSAAVSGAVSIRFDTLSTAVDAITATVDMNSIASAVWSAALADYTTAGTAGADLLSTLNLVSAGGAGLTADQVSAAVSGAVSIRFDTLSAAVDALNDLAATQISTIVAGELVAYDPPTRTEATNDKTSLIAEFALLNDISVDQVSAAVSGAVSARFDTLSAAVDGVTATVDVLSIASAVWSTALANYTTAGQAGADLLSTLNLVSTLPPPDEVSTIVTSALLTNGTTLTSVISGIWSAQLADYTTAGTAGADVLSTLNLVSAGGAGLTADQVSSIVSGAVSIRFDTLSAATVAVDVLSIASAVWSMPTSPYTTAGQAGADHTSILNLVSLIDAGAVNINSIVSAIWSAALVDYTTAGTAAANLLSAMNLTSAVRTEATTNKTSLIAEFALLNDITVDQVSAAVSGAVSARFNTLSAAIDALTDLTAAQISTIVAGELVDYDPPTRTEATADKASLIAEFALLNDLSVDQVSAAVSGAVSIRFDTLSTAVGAITATVDVLSIASAVWSTALADYTVAGQAGADLLSTLNLVSAGGAGLTADQVSSIVSGAVSIRFDTLSTAVDALNDLSPTQISTIVAGELVDYDPPTRTEATADKTSLIAEFALLNDVTIDQVSAAVSGAVSIRFDTLSAAVDALNDISPTQISTIVAGELVDYDPPTRTEASADKTSLIAEFALLNDISIDEVSAAVSGAVSSRFDTLSAAGTTVDVLSIASAVWSMPTAGYTTAGQAGADLLSTLNIATDILADTGTDGVAVADGAISSSKFAAGAIDASALAADAATEIANATWATIVESQGSITAQQAMQIAVATLAGATISAISGFQFLTPNSVISRVSVPSINADNERSAITLNFT